MITFDRPGSQITYTDDNGNPVSPPDGAWGSRQGKSSWAKTSRPFTTREEFAIRIAQEQGRVTVKGLAEAADVGRAAARSTLQELANEGVLERIGKGPNDPRQYYQLAKRA